MICSFAKKAIRVITNSKYNAHTKPLFQQLSILPLDRLNDFQVVCFVYRCVNNVLPMKFCSMFKTNSSVHSYNTRHCSELRHEYHRLNLRINTIRTYGVKLWNSLADELIKINSICVFKRQFKQSLLNSL